MLGSRLRSIALAAAIAAAFHATPSDALPPEVLQSVVSVLPLWPGKAQGGSGASPGTAPEGSGVVVAEGGLIATAWHVVEPAERIDVRLADGRILPARLVGHDRASDIALLQVDAALPALRPSAARPSLAQPVCAIGNAFGLGLSVTCGVVSAVNVSAAGFNAVEDFVQTDAAANPGSSGGALVDTEGRLVGMISAIFASKGDGDIGINFAVSARLLLRVVDDLRDNGTVDYVTAGWRLERLSREELAELAGARVVDLAAGGAAEAAGIEAGDLVLEIGQRPIREPRDAVAALALVPSEGSVDVLLRRDGQRRRVTLSFGARPLETMEPAADPDGTAATGGPDCPHPEPVCAVRQAVFPVESFDPAASAVRIAPDLLVTNRHVVGNRGEATVHMPAGSRKATVIASAYRGDLALLQVAGLPEDGLILAPDSGAALDRGPYFTVGADVARREIRVFDPGTLILGPAEGATLGRIHVTARMQPGTSGGALVDEDGRLIGIAVGGGDGRYEAVPADAIGALLAGRAAANAASVQAELGDALVRCAAAVEEASRAARGQAYDDELAAALTGDCRASENVGQYLEAGRLLGLAGAYDAAIRMHDAAVARVPHSVNARISLLVSLQLAGRFRDMLPHARWLLEVLPDDPQVHRFAIQSGIWGGDPDLAEAAYRRLLAVDPRQAQAARRFIDRPPPAPEPR